VPAETTESKTGHDRPLFIPADAVIADLKLLLRGVVLPVDVLGGHRSASALTPASVRIEVPPGLAALALAAAGLVVADEEGKPVAAVVDAVPVGDRGTVIEGRVEAVPPDRWQPLDSVADGRPLSVVIASRPLLTGDLDRLRAVPRDRDLVVVVPSAGSSPDRLPPALLEQVVRASVADQLSDRRVEVLPVEIAWRDTATDRVLTEAVSDALGGSQEPLTASDDWAGLLAALDGDGELPSVADPRVLAELRRWRPPRNRRGVVVLLSGLSGSGKSTLGRALAAHVLHASDRTVSLLDGDLVRRLLSSGLGFDHASRDLNVRRIGFVAAEVARHGGVAICAPIAPYAESRAAVRRMVEEVGDFVLVHVSTPLAVCEQRDVKGLYARARAGVIEQFTGVSDPYEEPTDADLTVDTSLLTVDEALGRLVEHLEQHGWLPSPSDSRP